MRINASTPNYHRMSKGNSQNNGYNNNSSGSDVAFCGAKPPSSKYIPSWLYNPFKNMSSFQQRLGLGVAALAFQPIIDYCNPFTDEKTRKFSVLKTVVKAVVGTTTGLIIRGAAMSLVRKNLKNPQKFLSKISNEDLKKEMTKVLSSKDSKDAFIANFGSVVGLAGVAVGDFTFDMPLAKIAIENTADKLGMSEYQKKEAK